MKSGFAVLGANDSTLSLWVFSTRMIRKCEYCYGLSLLWSDLSFLSLRIEVAKKLSVCFFPFLSFFPSSPLFFFFF